MGDAVRESQKSYGWARGKLTSTSQMPPLKVISGDIEDMMVYFTRGDGRVTSSSCWGANWKWRKRPKSEAVGRIGKWDWVLMSTRRQGCSADVEGAAGAER